MRRDPIAVRFIDWWARNFTYHPDEHWIDRFDFWMEGRNLTAQEASALFNDAAAEYHEREHDDPSCWHRWEKEPEGMVITEYPDMDEAA